MFVSEVVIGRAALHRAAQQFSAIRFSTARSRAISLARDGGMLKGDVGGLVVHAQAAGQTLPGGTGYSGRPSRPEGISSIPPLIRRTAEKKYGPMFRLSERQRDTESLWTNSVSRPGANDVTRSSP